MTLTRIYYRSVGTQAGNFHTVIHNHDVKTAYEELREYILKELEAQSGQGINITLKRVELGDE